MEVQEAIHQIAEIHRHLARSEQYRGYRPLTMAMTGSVAVLGGLLQPTFVSHGDEAAFVRFWIVLAAFNLLIVSAEICVDYVLRLTRYQRHLAWRSVAQFLPSLAAGGVCTFAFMGKAALLPGLWCMLFSLGIFASRPYLPHGVGWIGVYYLLAASVLLAVAPAALSLAPWAMGATFGVGQFSLALVLHFNLERPSLDGSACI